MCQYGGKSEHVEGVTKELDHNEIVEIGKTRLFARLLQPCHTSNHLFFCGEPLICFIHTTFRS